jgi:hypothetical protein
MINRSFQRISACKRTSDGRTDKLQDIHETRLALEIAFQKDKFQYAQTDTVTSLFEAALQFTNAIDSILMVLDHFGI